MGENEMSEILSSGGDCRGISFEVSPWACAACVAALVAAAPPPKSDMVEGARRVGSCCCCCSVDMRVGGGRVYVVEGELVDSKETDGR